ncbi:hypothetical protein SK128_011328, partial [Halocaridina rubra]
RDLARSVEEYNNIYMTVVAAKVQLNTRQWSTTTKYDSGISQARLLNTTLAAVKYDPTPESS